MNNYNVPFSFWGRLLKQLRGTSVHLLRNKSPGDSVLSWMLSASEDCRSPHQQTSSLDACLWPGGFTCHRWSELNHQRCHSLVFRCKHVDNSEVIKMLKVFALVYVFIWHYGSSRCKLTLFSALCTVSFHPRK